jgi:hypothetical protein
MADLDQVERGEVFADIAFAVRFVGGGFAAEAEGAKLVLIAMAAGVEEPRFVCGAASAKGRAVYIRAAGPDAAEAGARGTDVIVHLPAGAEAVLFVGGPEGVDHLAANGVTEVGETVEWFEVAESSAETLLHSLRDAIDLDQRRAGRVSRDALLCEALLVPAMVGGGSGQSVGGSCGEGREDGVEPALADDAAVLEEDDDVGRGAGCESIEASGRAEFLRGAGLRQVRELTKFGQCGLVGTVGEKDEFKGLGRVRGETLQRATQTEWLIADMDADADGGHDGWASWCCRVK